VAELREGEAYAQVMVGALCDLEIAAGRGYEEVPPEVEAWYDRMTLYGYAATMTPSGYSAGR